MTEENTSNTGISGKMFLYEQPELLSSEAHGSMGFTPAERPFDFARHARAVPLTTIEFGSAQRNYPIIFSELENPIPLAMLGLLDDVNLFVGDDGRWDDFAYLPTYLRCHPFTFARDPGGQMALVVDRGAASISETPEYPFFEGDEPSQHTKRLIRDAYLRRARECPHRIRVIDAAVDVDAVSRQIVEAVEALLQ